MSPPTTLRSTILGSLTVVLATSCARPSDPASPGPDAAPVTSADTSVSLPTGQALETSHAYGCGKEYRFVAQLDQGGESVRLLLPDTTVTLPHVVSASGARYGNDGFSYWSKDDEALLETPERAFSGCLMDQGGPGWQDAKARGVDFRAVGQEPGWLLDVHDGDSIAVTTDYGQSRYRFPPVQPEMDRGAGRTVYRIETEAHRATIIVEDEPCRDAMSGWPYEATVSMTLDAREFDGCGRRL